MRAYRPSLMGGEDLLEEEVQHHREENVKVYCRRAQAGLPLFDPPVKQGQTAAGGNLLQVRSH